MAQPYVTHNLSPFAKRTKQSPQTPILAEKYGLEGNRLAKGDEVCIKCGLCVRVCDEVVD